MFSNRGQPEDYDLIISWGNIYSNIEVGTEENKQRVNKLLISGDSINLTQATRDIPILGTIRGYIIIILDCMIAFSLLKQIYNLILSTLGIDNPYLYENDNIEQDIYDNVTTGESYEMTKIGRYHIRRDTTRPPNHRKIGF